MRISSGFQIGFQWRFRTEFHYISNRISMSISSGFRIGFDWGFRIGFHCEFLGDFEQDFNADFQWISNRISARISPVGQQDVQQGFTFDYDRVFAKVFSCISTRIFDVHVIDFSFSFLKDKLRLGSTKGNCILCMQYTGTSLQQERNKFLTDFILQGLF